MGDPKKLRKKYSTPNHPWQKARIDEEKELMSEYGMKNKKELWKMVSTLKNYKQRLKQLIPRKDAQAEVERKQLISKLRSLGIISADASQEDVLGITMRQVMDRRLSTLVLKKGLASSIRQARQFVTHEHVSVNGRMINSPSYLVPIEEEPFISVSDKVMIEAEPIESIPGAAVPAQQETASAAEKPAEDKKAEPKAATEADDKVPETKGDASE